MALTRSSVVDLGLSTTSGTQQYISGNVKIDVQDWTSPCADGMGNHPSRSYVRQPGLYRVYRPAMGKTVARPLAEEHWSLPSQINLARDAGVPM
ncbi:MAG TPA: hypothetical protein VFX56_07900 [Nitrospira sp.]|nr:hypothetical protein [Nitrospira sp.]